MNMTRLLRLERPLATMLVVLAAGAYLLAAIALTVEASEDDVLAGDVAVARWIQNTNVPGVQHLVDALNWVGQAGPLVVLAWLVVVGLLVTRHYAESLLMVSAVGVHLLNYTLKHLAASPRPTPDVVRVTVHASGFGFPSGHTMSSVVYFGIIMYLAWRIVRSPALRLTIQTLSLLLMLGIGFSRIYTGAHWPSDVLGGYLWGVVYVVFVVSSFHRCCPLVACRAAARQA
jgi:undecaprenyl-diphosphatase